jgi:ankyrin repeat protein
MAAQTASTDQLFSAIAAGDLAQVTQALDADPTLVGAPNGDGLSPLMWSLYTGHRDIADSLLSRLPDDRLTIHEAAATGRLARLTALLDAAAESVNAWSPDGFQPLGLAAFFGQPEAVDLLLARGAEVDTPARHTFGVTPLQSALASPTPQVARTLVAAGADVNKPQPSGATPLHSAAYIGSIDLVEFLLSRGANLNAQDNQGRTPAQVAQAQNHPEAAALLEQRASS